MKETFVETIKNIFGVHKPIITSILDQDQYKFSMGNAVLELFPDTIVEYRFKNRGKQRFNQDFLDAFNYQVQLMADLKLTDREYDWFKKTAKYLKPWYFEYLKNFRFNPNQITASLDSENNLVLDIKGYWHEAIMWEVPLMALISELYFKIIDTNWNMDGQQAKICNKASELSKNNCIFTDFGTRRRRNFETQDIVVREMKEFTGFFGTSNVLLSMKNETVPKGSMAHEFYMGMQALEGIRNSNYYALNNWVRVYNSDLGTALPDTLGSEQFLKNFNLRFANLFSSVRHDSGDPIWFTDLFVNHYKKLGIDPMTKTIIFSNALDVEKAIEIKKYCEGKIKCAFGIGTSLTNSFDNSPPLNMVIKLYSVNDIPVVKISDDAGKEMGDKDALRVTKWECFGTPLDAEKIEYCKTK